MKVVRVIKVLCFILALITLAVAVAGNVFIIRDTYLYDVNAADVKKALDENDFEFKELFSDPFTAQAEEADEGEDDFDELESDDDEIINEAPVTAEPTIEEDVEDDPASESDYSLSKYHCKAVIALMEAGSYQIPEYTYDDLGKPDDMFFINKIHVESENDNINLVCSTINKVADNFSMNLWMLISYGLLTLSFILHLISKKHQSFGGVLLMLFGYIIFLLFSAFGIFLANMDYLGTSFESLDFYSLRIYAFASQAILGAILGLGFYKSGSKSGTIRFLKKRLRRKHKA